MKQGWKTSEFWVLIGSVIAKTIDPTIPEELVYLAGTYIAGRVAQKSVTSYAKSQENKSPGVTVENVTVDREVKK